MADERVGVTDEAAETSGAAIPLLPTGASSFSRQFERENDDDDRPTASDQICGIVLANKLRGAVRDKTPSEIAAEDEKEKLMDELGRLQVATMHDMVQDVEVPYGDTTTVCKFLYLTNKQASEIPMSGMAKVRSSMGLGTPKMVIRLMPSRYGKAWWKAFPYDEKRFPARRTPEKGYPDLEATEQKLLLFCKEVVLPLAVQANALVVGQEACSLTSAFLKVSSGLQHYYRDRCPFHVLIFVRACTFDVKAKEAGSVASHYRKQTKLWQHSEIAFETALKNRFGDDRAFWPQLDLIEGLYGLVMFEGLTGISPNFTFKDLTAQSFQNDFFSALSGVPIISTLTYGTEQMQMVPAIAEHVSRGMPLMLIDSRDRNLRKKATLDDVDEALTKSAEDLHNSGVADWYSTSVMAWIRSAIDAERENEEHEDHIDRPQHEMLLWEAINMQIKKSKRAKKDTTDTKDRDVEDEIGLMGDGGKDVDGNSNPHADRISRGAGMLMRYVGAQLEWEMDERHKRCRLGIDALEKTENWEELEKSMEENWLEVRGCCFYVYDELTEFCRINPWADFRENGSKPNPRWFRGQFELEIRPDCATPEDDFKTCKGKLLELLKQTFDESRFREFQSFKQQAFCQNEEIWLGAYEILQAENVHSASLHDLAGCRKTLNTIAHIDYLPAENSLEGLVLLRRAWTLHDVFATHSVFYKRVSRIAYLSLLLIGTASLVLVTISGMMEGENAETFADTVKNVVLGLSFVGSFVSGYTAFMEPSRKWFKLRSAASHLHSEIWKFRTRMGNYAGEHGASAIARHQNEQDAQKRLSDFLAHVQDSVKQGAGLTRTSIYAITTTAPDTFVKLEEETPAGLLSIVPGSQQMAMTVKKVSGKLDPHMANANYIMHGQFNIHQAHDRSQDNFHSPALPDDYVRFRLMPLRDYYQTKIPKMVKRYRLFQGLILISSVVSAFLSQSDVASTTAIVASIAGLVKAWQEFTGVEKNLDRFSSVATSLENTLMWWQSLPTNEQKLMCNVEALVLMTEDHVTSELSAWVSDNSEKNEDGKKEGGKSSEADKN